MTERRIFAGACFLVDGKMACGTVKQELCVHVGPDMHDRALGAKHTRVMDLTGARGSPEFCCAAKAGCARRRVRAIAGRIARPVSQTG